jgi:citrate lyase synthetase
MTTPTVTEIRRNGNQVGARVELGRYCTNTGQERVVYGQRIATVVIVTDVPATEGREYLVERGLEEDGYAALLALVRDYLQQANELGTPPMSKTPLE